MFPNLTIKKSWESHVIFHDVITIIILAKYFSSIYFQKLL